ncbi:MAG: Na+/H+ antiporter NhaA [Aliarcobacter sp.]|nr:Na+/H+ antiporter NhaA [Aliarcobacter sp.]
MKVLVGKFLEKESASGIILIFVTIIALIFSNTFLSEFYNTFLHTKIEFRVGTTIEISKPLILWVNDGLMAIFFLMIGLEIKRELILGHLSKISNVTLPLIGAIGGMLIPALIFFLFNKHDEFALRGWAIPTATDIAFALGILVLLGKRVPTSLKIFLMALAIFDDLGAILIIAFFYTAELSSISLVFGTICILILILLNRFKVHYLSLYAIVGFILWICILKTGVHATLTGIILAFTIPISIINEKRKHISPIRTLEHFIHNWVTYFILPIFAFVNAGIDLRLISLEQMNNSVSWGIFLSVFIGKQLGVFTFIYIAVKLNLTKLPTDVSWAQLYGVAVLTGVGFTMSLFIDSLAYVDSSTFFYTDKLAILLGSLFSGLVGYLILLNLKVKKSIQPEDIS